MIAKIKFNVNGIFNPTGRQTLFFGLLFGKYIPYLFLSVKIIISEYFYKYFMFSLLLICLEILYNIFIAKACLKINCTCPAAASAAARGN